MYPRLNPHSLCAENQIGLAGSIAVLAPLMAHTRKLTRWRNYALISSFAILLKSRATMPYGMGTVFNSTHEIVLVIMVE